jgi:hypothetical protein
MTGSHIFRNASSFEGSIWASSGSIAVGSVLGSGGGSVTGGVVSGGSSFGTGGFSGGGTLGRVSKTSKSFAGEHRERGLDSILGDGRS